MWGQPCKLPYWFSQTNAFETKKYRKATCSETPSGEFDESSRDILPNRRNVIITYGSNSNQCPWCQTSFASKPRLLDLHRHLCRCSKSKYTLEFVCESCGKQFPKGLRSVAVHFSRCKARDVKDLNPVGGRFGQLGSSERQRGGESLCTTKPKQREKPRCRHFWKPDELRLLRQVERLEREKCSKSGRAFRNVHVYNSFCQEAAGAAASLTMSQVLSQLKALQKRKEYEHTSEHITDQASVGSAHSPPSPTDFLLNYERRLRKSAKVFNSYEVSFRMEDVLNEALDSQYVVDKLFCFLSQLARTSGSAKSTRKARKLKQTRRKVANTSVAQNSRQLKRAKYAKVQDLWRKNKKDCFRMVIGEDTKESVNPINRQDILTYWQTVLGAESQDDDQPVALIQDCSRAFGPLTNLEIKTALLRGKRKAKGVDKLTAEALLGIPLELLGIFFNVILFLRKIPASFKANRTVLIPKPVAGPRTAGSFRPITVASAMLRVLHSALAKRLSSVIEFHPSQAGFVAHRDNALRNVQILDHVIRFSRNSRQSVFVASLDVAKAFDSVSWHSIDRAMEAFGFPQPIVEYIRATYYGSTTVLQLGGKDLGNPVPFMRGVKQGDPLSPLLFNMIVDQLLRSLPPEIGVRVGNVRVNSLAFADDLVLIAESETGLQSLLRVAERFYCQRGLVLNTEKSKFLGVQYQGKEKTSSAVQSCPVRVDGANLSTVMSGGTIKYLGVDFSHSGKRPMQIVELRSLLDRLLVAPLKPQQKLYLLRCHLIPRMLYQLTMGKVTVGLLSECDSLIKKYVKSWLHLPDWTSDAFLYLPIAMGGLGIACLRYSVLLSLRRRLLSFQSSTDQLAREYALTPEYAKTLSYLTKCCTATFDEVPVALKNAKHLSELLLNHWGKTVKGRGCNELAMDKDANQWLSGLDPRARGKEFIQLVKLRCDALECLANSYPQNLPCCRLCRNRFQKETIAHILQCCTATHDARIARHDKLLRMLADEWLRVGFQVFLEPQLRTSLFELRKPDIVLRKDNDVFLLDLAVPIESSNSFCTSYAKKVNYYRVISRSEITQLVGDINVRVHRRAFVVGAKGAIAEETQRVALETGLNRGFLTALRLAAMRLSVQIHSCFVKRLNLVVGDGRR